MGDEAAVRPPRGRILTLSRLLLIIIIVSQLGYTIFCFGDKKDGFFGDEIWGYGLANSYYKPFIYMKEGISIDEDLTYETLDNYNEWTDGQVFEDYITVQPGERFAYGSVISNQSLDHHPPLYYMLLHTVCSFFPDSFSFIYGFVLNCVFLVLTTLYLYRLSELMTGSSTAALIATSVYALSTGALSTFIYIRQYSLFTALLTMSAYYAAALFYKLRRGEEYKLPKLIPPIAVTSFLTFYSHYYGIVFIGILTAVLCLWMLFHKKIKAMFIYGGSVLAALLVFFAVYPASIRQAMASREHSAEVLEDMVLPFWANFRFGLSQLFRNSIGVRVPIMEEDWIYYVLAGLVLLAGLCVPICFLVRKEKWFAPIKTGAVNGVKTLGAALRHADAMFIGITAAMFINVYLICCQVDIYGYLNTASRYVFHLMPMACAAAVFLIYKAAALIPFFRKPKRMTALLALLAAVAVARTNILWPCDYYFSIAGNNMDVRDSLAGKNCLLVFPTDLSMNCLSNFPSYVGKANKVYATMIYDLDASIDEIAQEPVDYIIVNTPNYCFTVEQFAAIRQLYERHSAYLNENLFKFDEEGDEEPEPEDGAEGEEEEYVGMESEKLYELCPKDEYMPEYVIDVNKGIFVVLKHVTSESSEQ